MPSNKPIVKYCENHFEASFLKEFLLSKGVKAWFDGEDSMGFMGRYAVIGRGVALRVLPTDLNRARKLLENVPEPEPLDENEEYDVAGEQETARKGESAPIPDVCPNCGSTKIGRARQSRAITILLFGLPLLFQSSSWSCSECGWFWKP